MALIKLFIEYISKIFTGYIVFQLLLKFASFCRNGFFRNLLSKFAVRIPYLRNMYMEEYEKLITKFKLVVRKRWGKFGMLTTKIPDEKWSLKRINEFIKMI